MRTLEPYSTNPAGFRRAWTRDILRWVGAGTGAKGKGAGDGSEDEDDGVSWTSRRIKYWQWKSWENTTRCTNAFRFLPEALLNHLVEMYFGFPHMYLMSTSSPVSPNYTDFALACPQRALPRGRTQQPRALAAAARPRTRRGQADFSRYPATANGNHTSNVNSRYSQSLGTGVW
ncbi:hypothetical protein DFH08DRAFT_970125 [Mycena albidolilacea]|uniref:Uncharacterized protein n=1 Tax=Mycena albidolilacea TaxID=1033008 RepID=A0AAD6ZH18_9AGAR|nr:hypothetical protein DFH08DRAFT_970125 [Mycena albidolilacea]